MSSPVLSVETAGEEESRRLGADLAARISPPACVILTGALGSGKTVICRGICEGLGVDPAGVSSPSFALVNLYAGRVPVAHVDLYRLGAGDAPVPADELREAGILDVLASPGVVLVEWGERLGPETPAGALLLRIETAGGDRRRITVRRL